MGDCRIKIQVTSEALASLTEGTRTGRNEDLTASSRTTVANKVCSSDTTVCEVFEDISLNQLLSFCSSHNEDVMTSAGTSSLVELLKQKQVSLWDYTVHPPKNISDWLTEKYPDRQGVKSLTLYDAGWYPSGIIQVQGLNEKPRAAASAGQYEKDTQYNKVQSDGESKTPVSRNELVKLTDQEASGKTQGRPLPSQVLGMVPQRFDDEKKQAGDANMVDSAETIAARAQRRQNKVAAAEKERKRQQKLEQRIRKLEEKQQGKAKNKKVSAQVQRMLIKSRATGRKQLKREDRIHLRCIVVSGDDDDDDAKEEYRFFSPQDSAGRIVESFSHPTMSSAKTCARQKQPQHVEMLVLRKNNSKSNDQGDEGNEAMDHLYRRVPVLTRLYEAIGEGYISDFDKVVIRFYDPSKGEEPTMSIADAQEDEGSTSG